MITSTSTRVQKTEVSYHVKTINNLQFSMVWDSPQQDSKLMSRLQLIVLGKNKTATLWSEGESSWIHSTSQECKNWKVLPCQDYEELPILHGLRWS